MKTNEKSVQLISPRGDLFLKCQKPNTMIISKIHKVCSGSGYELKGGDESEDNDNAML